MENGILGSHGGGRAWKGGEGEVNGEDWGDTSGGGDHLEEEEEGGEGWGQSAVLPQESPYPHASTHTCMHAYCVYTCFA